MIWDGDDAETIGVIGNTSILERQAQRLHPGRPFSVGDELLTLHGQKKRLTALLPRPGPPEIVYNLEVHGEHVYDVGRPSVLVHNKCYCTVQDAGDAARLRSGNGVWPNSPSRSALGEGVWAFDKLEDAIRYQKGLHELHGIETPVIKSGLTTR